MYDDTFISTDLSKSVLLTIGEKWMESRVQYVQK